MNGTTLTGVVREVVKAVTRSSGWRKVRKEAIDAHPYCAVCGRKHLLQVHHKKPFQHRPELELDPDNLIVLCGRCHLLIGHWGWWKATNPYIDFYASTMSVWIKTRSPEYVQGTYAEFKLHIDTILLLFKEQLKLNLESGEVISDSIFE